MRGVPEVPVEKTASCWFDGEQNLWEDRSASRFHSGEVKHCRCDPITVMVRERFPKKGKS